MSNWLTRLLNKTVSVMPSSKEMDVIRVAPHIHDLVFVNCQAQVRRPMIPAETIVLYGCASCDYVDTRTIDGTWTPDQLQALQRHPAESENG